MVESGPPPPPTNIQLFSFQLFLSRPFLLLMISCAPRPTPPILDTLPPPFKKLNNLYLKKIKQFYNTTPNWEFAFRKEEKHGRKNEREGDVDRSSTFFTIQE